MGGLGAVRWQHWADDDYVLLLLLYSKMHKPICTPFSFFPFRRFPAGYSRIPTCKCVGTYNVRFHAPV